MKHHTVIHGNPRSSMSRTGGFSLIEMIIGSAVFIVVLLAIYIILDTGHRDYASGAVKSDVQENVRVVLESMARELRMAGFAPGKAGCSPPPTGAVTVLSPLTFQADANGDNCADQVVYSFIPPTNATRPCDPDDAATIGKITRSIQAWDGTTWNPVTPTAYEVAQCVKGMSISAYNSAGVLTTNPADVRRITISITGEGNVRNQSPRAYTLSTDIRLRNL
jgi:Tfp pilus assembly protein PilW